MDDGVDGAQPGSVPGARGKGDVDRAALGVRAADLVGEIERLLREREVETIQPFTTRANDARAVPVALPELVDTSVLAELDRLLGGAQECKGCNGGQPPARAPDQPRAAASSGSSPPSSPRPASSAR